MKRGDKVFLKNLQFMYIQKGLTLGSIFFFLRILNIFNTHKRGEERRFFKETYSDVYPKEPNSLIYNSCFKPLLLTLIFQCGINQLFFILRILSIFNIHTGRGEKVF